jgi:hypothetical protein
MDKPGTSEYDALESAQRADLTKTATVQNPDGRGLSTGSEIRPKSKGLLKNQPGARAEKGQHRFAHDLLSPLCTIEFLCSWIADEYGNRLGLEGRESFSLLQQSIERMRTVIEMSLH